MKKIKVFGVCGHQKIKYELCMPFGSGEAMWQVSVNNRYHGTLKKVRQEWHIYLHPTTALTTFEILEFIEMTEQKIQSNE